jgi:hypothetical protein
MPLLPRSLKWRTILLTLLGLFAVGVSAWWTFRVRVSAFVSQQFALARLRNGDDPVAREFARGRFAPDTPLDELLAEHPSPDVLRYDRYTLVMYEPGGVAVLAVDGRVRKANTRGPGWHSFFDTLTPAEQSANDLAFTRWQAAGEFEQQSALAAVAGPAAAGPPSPPADGD